MLQQNKKVLSMFFTPGTPVVGDVGTEQAQEAAQLGPAPPPYARNGMARRQVS